MAYLGTKPANQVIDSTLIADGTITPSDLSTGKPVWDTSGNVGIGTASPSTFGKLAAVSADDSATVVASSATGMTRIYGYTTGFGGAYIDSANAAQNAFLPITINGSIASIATGGAERMRIDSSGNLLVGYTTIPASATNAKIISSNAIAAGSGFYCKAGTSASTWGNLFNINWSGSSLQAWVDATNVGTFTLTSDYRIKRNIETQTVPALERVMALRPVTYQMADYKDGLFKASDDVKEGFIAHEVQEVIPSGAEGVKDDENQIQSLRVDAILSVAVKAIQEQQAIITELKTRIEALEQA